MPNAAIVGVGEHLGQRVGRRPQVLQPALLGLGVPRLVVVVAAEDDLLVGRVGLLDHLGDRLADVGAAVDLRLDLVGELVDRLGDDRVQDRVRERERHARPERAELELVAGEGERRGPVAVAAVHRQRRQHRGAEAEERVRRCRRRPRPEAIDSNTLSSSAPRKIEMIAGGASLAPEAVVLADVRDRGPQQALVLVDRLDHRGAEEQEARCSPPGSRPGPSGCGPVSVPIDQLLCLPEPLTPANGFSCSRQTSPYLRATFCITCIVSCWWSEPTFEFSKIGAISYWPGRDLVVAGLDRHAELAQLGLGLQHAGEDPLRDRAEVVVVELVALRRLGAEQRPPGGHQVGALEEVLLVDQEVLLLGADGREDALGLRRRRAAAAPGSPTSRARPSSAAAGSSRRAPRRSTTRTRSGCRAARRSGSRG